MQVLVEHAGLLVVRLTDSQDDEYDADVGDASGVVPVDVRLIRGILVTSSHLGLLQTPLSPLQLKNLPPGLNLNLASAPMPDLKICQHQPPGSQFICKRISDFLNCNLGNE